MKVHITVHNILRVHRTHYRLTNPIKNASGRNNFANSVYVFFILSHFRGPAFWPPTTTIRCTWDVHLPPVPATFHQLNKFWSNFESSSRFASSKFPGRIENSEDLFVIFFFAFRLFFPFNFFEKFASSFRQRNLWPRKTEPDWCNGFGSIVWKKFAFGWRDSWQTVIWLLFI